MGKSLQEQLLEAGLVSKRAANEAGKRKQKQARRAKGGAAGPDLAKLYALRAREEQAERSRQLNEQRRLEAERKALRAEIKQLIESSRVARDDGEIAYRFTYRDKIKSVRVTAEQRRRLISGDLALASLGGRFELVPGAVAEKIRQRDPARVVLVASDLPSTAAADDPYADFQVPDDLVW